MTLSKEFVSQETFLRGSRDLLEFFLLDHVSQKFFVFKPPSSVLSSLALRGRSLSHLLNNLIKGLVGKKLANVEICSGSRNVLSKKFTTNWDHQVTLVVSKLRLLGTLCPSWYYKNFHRHSNLWHVASFARHFPLKSWRIHLIWWASCWQHSPLFEYILWVTKYSNKLPLKNI